MKSSSSSSSSIEGQIEGAMGMKSDSGAKSSLRQLATDSRRVSAIIKILLAQSGADRLIGLPSGSPKPELWSQSMSEVQYTDMITKVKSPIAGKEEEDGVWTFYGDGQRRSADAARATIKKLYTTKILKPGDTDAVYDSGTVTVNSKKEKGRILYLPLDPANATVTAFMSALRTLPRSHVNKGKIAFVAKMQMQTQPLGSGSGAAWLNIGDPQDVPGSFYIDGANCSIIKVTADSSDKAVASTGAVGKASDQASYGAVGEGPPANVFTNNVRHEIGHAVGVKKVGSMPTSGDDFAKAYGGWQTRTIDQVKAATWNHGSAPPATKDVNIDGKTQKLSSSAVFDWLTQSLQKGAEPANNAVTDIKADVGKKREGIASAFSDRELVKYWSAVWSSAGKKLAAMRASAYLFPGYVPTSDPIVWVSRATSPGWQKYSHSAYTAMHDEVGWYSLASHREMFAEMYTHRYSGGKLPPELNGKDPKAFFKQLESAEGAWQRSEKSLGTKLDSTS